VSEDDTTVFEAFCAAGLWPGLSRTTAGRLAAAHVNGPDDVSVDTLAKVEGVAPKRAEKLAKSFANATNRYAVAELLHHANLSVRIAAAAVDQLGGGAATVLRADPWRLLDCVGGGSGALQPRDVDRFALATLDERPEKTDPRRGRAFTAYVLSRASRDGHTVLPEETVAAALAGLDVPHPAGAIEAAIEDSVVADFPAPAEHGDPSAVPARILGLTRYAMAEDSIAGSLHRLLATAEPLATPEGSTAVTGGLDPAQREAVQQVAEHGVVVLHGGPGTGKSRTVAAVVELVQARHKRIALAAPTGRAAKRLEELTGHEATTLHRLLGAQGPRASEATGAAGAWTGTGEFLRGETWPLDADVVVVDETSMLDVELAAALLDACADGTHLLLVGDPAQLPSIGPGRVLGDVLDAGVVPTVELTTLHRQAEGGTIARLAAEVRIGELPMVDDPEHEVVVVRAAGSDDAARRVRQLVTDSIPRVLGIPPGDVQVVTPVHRGPAGTAALNQALKQALNPGSGTVSGFDVGDRVVATANHLDDGFANGEVGVVLAIGDGALTVEFGGGPVVVPPRAVVDLVHGWAITVHRAQGSEWPAVVSVLPPEAGGMLSRPLVYTAWTRAQRHLSVVTAAGGALARGVREVGARPRRTRLTTILRGED
jgi:exodeoxyribonuclease V alpha subunit